MTTEEELSKLEINLALIVAAAIKSSDSKRLEIKSEYLVEDYSEEQLAISYDAESDIMFFELVPQGVEDES